MELPVLEIAQPRRKTLSDQSEEGKYMIARTSGIGKVLLDLQDGVVVEQAVENIGCLALGRADRQNAEIAVLIGKVAVKFRAWLDGDKAADSSSAIAARSLVFVAMAARRYL